MRRIGIMPGEFNDAVGLWIIERLQQDSIDHAEEVVFAPMPRASARIAASVTTGYCEVFETRLSVL